jgi:type I restriction enzyme S subunit
MGNGVRQNLGYSEFKNLSIPLPPLSEQEHIVSYLDDKTTKIDELIQKKLRKIDLLKEYRTSLINTVVTKGLNHDVPMKDSGIEWIGKIPSHWEVKSLKYIVNENQIALGSNTRDDYEVDYVEISDLDSYGNITNSTHYLFSESPSRCRRVLRQGDVFISTVRTYLRSIGIVENNVKDLICSTGFSVLTPKKSILSKYLFFMLRTEWFISDVVRKSEGVSYPSIQSDKLLTTKIVHPPLTEQEQIVSYLDEKTSQIDKTIDIEKKKIELLKEYRQSLISNVVTGNIKVIE